MVTKFEKALNVISLTNFQPLTKEQEEIHKLAIEVIKEELQKEDDNE